MIKEEDLKNTYINLKKASSQINSDYNKLTKEDKYLKTNYKKMSKNLNNYEKYFNETKKLLDESRDDLDISEEVKSTVEKGLNKVREEREQMIQIIKDKINHFDNNIEERNEEEEEEENKLYEETIMHDLIRNNEILKQRKKELEEINKTSELIKDVTEKMANDYNKKNEKIKTEEIYSDNIQNNIKKENIKIYKEESSLNLLCILLSIIFIIIIFILFIYIIIIFFFFIFIYFFFFFSFINNFFSFYNLINIKKNIYLLFPISVQLYSSPLFNTLSISFNSFFINSSSFLNLSITSYISSSSNLCPLKS